MSAVTTGAIHGRITATEPQHYPELIGYRALPFGEQDVFEAALDAFLARRSEPLTEAETQLATAVGREMWRASLFHGLAVRGREVRAGMEEGAETLIESASAEGGRA